MNTYIVEVYTNTQKCTLYTRTHTHTGTDRVGYSLGSLTTRNQLVPSEPLSFSAIHWYIPEFLVLVEVIVRVPPAITTPSPSSSLTPLW